MSLSRLQFLSKRAVVAALLALAIVGADAQTPAGKITVAWDAVTPPAGLTITGYQACYGTVPGAYPACDPVAGNVTSHVFSGLADCTPYYIAVKAVASNGETSAAWSNEINGWAQPRVVSAAPGAITAGRVQEVVFTGANFGPDSTVQIPGATIGLVTVTDCRTIRAMVNASAAGSPVVTVRSAGVAGVPASGTFQVVAAIRPANVSGVRRDESPR